MSVELEFETRFLVRVSATDDIEQATVPRQAMERSGRATEAAEPEGSAFVVALESEDCFAVPLEADSSGRFKRQQLSYDLETWIPLDAEDICLATIGKGDCRLVISAAKSLLLQAAAKITGGRWTAVCVCPYAFLSLDALTTQLSDGDRDWLLIANRSNFDLFRVRDGLVLQWYWLGNNLHGISRELLATDDTEGDEWRMTTAGLTYEQQQCVDRKLDCGRETSHHQRVVHLEIDLSQTVRAQAERIAKGVRRAPINLIRGEVASEFPNRSVQLAFRAAALGVLLLAIGTITALAFRGLQYEQAANAEAELQQEIFSELFPGQRIPVGITRRLRSAVRSLENTRGSSAPEVLEITPMLRSLLVAVPADGGVEITHFELATSDGQPSLASLRGYAEDFETLDSLHEGLRRSGFSVGFPGTTQSEGQVTMRLEAVAFGERESPDREGLP